MRQKLFFLLLTVFFLLSETGNAQITAQDSGACLLTGDVWYPVGTVSGHNTYETLLTSSFVYTRVRWSTANNRWEIVVDIDGDGNFNDILHYNNFNSSPNPPALGTGAWVNTPFGCGVLQQFSGAYTYSQPAPSITEQPSSRSICESANTTFTVTAINASSYQWQFSNGGAFANVPNSAPYSGGNTAALTITGVTSAMNGYSYRAVVNGASSINSSSATLTVYPTMSASTNKTDVSCKGGNNGTASVSVSGGTTPYTYSWAPWGGTNPTASGLSAGTYTVTVTDSNNCQATQSLTIAEPANAIVAPSVVSLLLEQGAPASALTAISGNNGLLWYTSETGGVGTTIAPIPDTSAAGATSYWVSSTREDGCESSRVELVVTVLAPSAPTVLSPQIYVGAGTLANLTATGTNLKWYTALTGGTPLDVETALVDDTTYYVSQTPGIIESIRVPVTVKKISEVIQTLCEQATIADLAANTSANAIAKWYTDATGGTALDATQPVTSGTYYAEQVEPESRIPLGFGFNNPNAIVVDAQGNIYVADTNSNSIKKMNQDGTNIQILGSGFIAPRDIALDAQENIYILDGNSSIKKMDADGTNIQILASGLNYLDAFALDAQGNIYASERPNNTIRKMDANGNYIQNLGNGFSRPMGIAIDAQGNIYVADSENNVIKKMDANGNNIQVLGSGFSYPISRVALDAQGNIYVADNLVVRKMDANGTNIQILGDNGFFNFTKGLTVDAQGNVYGAYNINNYVSIYKTKQTNISNRVAVTVNAMVAPSVVSLLLEQGAPASALTAVSGNTGLLWYTTETGGIGTTTAPIPDTSAAGATSYWVSSTRENGCESSRVELVVTVLAPSAPIVVSPQIYAGTGTLANLTATGTNLKWYTALTGGTPLDVETVLVDGATYYVSQTPGIIESIRVPVVVKKISEATQTLCEEATIADLAAVPTANAIVKWYTDATGGTALDATQPVTSGTYYAEQVEPESSIPLGNGFVFPQEIAFDAQGNIYVADTGNGQIKKMNPDGSNIQTLGSFYNPQGIVLDAQGNVYILDSYGIITKMDASGNFIQTLGSGFNYPKKITIDAQGNIYIVDTNNHAIKKMNNDGSNIQILGSGFIFPQGIAIDAQGNIYVADSSNNAIKKMDSNGNNIQILGSGFSYPRVVTLDTQGNIYVADSGNDVIKKMNNDGSNIQTLDSSFNYPLCVAVDTHGNVYVGDDIFNSPIYKITQKNYSNRVAVTVNAIVAPSVVPLLLEQGAPASALTAVSGNNGLLWYTSETGGVGTTTAPIPDTSAAGTTSYWVSSTREDGCESKRVELRVTVQWPQKPLAISPQVYVGSATIENLTANGINLSWYSSETGGTPLDAQTALVDGTTYYVSQTPGTIESDRTEVLVQKIGEPTQTFCEEATIADLVMTPSANTTVKWYADATGDTVLNPTELLKSGTYYAEQIVPQSIIQLGSGFSYPNGVAVDAQGNIYIADSDNNAIKKMNPDGSNIQTLGSGFSYPNGVAVDAQGNIYISDSDNHAIKKMDANGSNIQTLGSGFNYPRGIALDVHGNIYIADSDNNAIKKMNHDGSNIQSLGSGFYYPSGVAVDAQGNIYIADSSNSVIKKMDANGNNIQTLGSGFSYPNGVTLDTQGNIYVADSNNSAIKKMNNDGSNIQTLDDNFNYPLCVAVDTHGNVYVGDDRYNSPIYKIIQENNSNRVAVTVNAIVPPSVKNVVLTLDVPAAPLTAVSGNTGLLWYTSATGGTGSTIAPIPATTAMGRTSYWVSSTREDGCESSRVELVVTVQEPSAPTVVSLQVYAGAGTIANLTAAGTNLKWYATDTGGMALDIQTALIDGTTYYVSQSPATLESPRAAVTVKKISEATQTFCEGATVDHLTATPSTNATVKWYTDAIGGTALSTTEALATGIYYVEQTTPESIIDLGSGFVGPFGIDIDAQGNIYIADMSNNTIKKMDNNGNNIQTLGDNFNRPYGVALDNQQNVYVTDAGNNAIKKMNNDGSNIQTLANGFTVPVGITVDDDGRVYFTDPLESSVKRMNHDGSDIQNIGSGFNQPVGIAIDEQGNIYVADSQNDAIKKMDSNGNTIQTIGSGFDLPFGVALDAQGNIYVTDMGNNAIKKMDSNGNNIQSIANISGEFSGIKVDLQGNVYLVSPDQSIIKKIISESISNRVAVIVSSISVSTSSEDISCNGANDGSIDLAVSGGALPYTYAWSNGATAQNLSGLGQGSYTVTVTDANGCTATASLTIAEPTVLSASITSSEDVSCNGANDGSIDLTVSGGALPYTYAWSNGTTAQNLSGLGQGSYSVIVTDANGCTATASVTIAEPTVLSASITSSEDVSCNGANDGSIDLAVSGGALPYTYAWSNGTTAQNLSGLGQGSYSVIVTDANGCTATASVTIAEPTVLSASITSSEDVSCNGANDGSIDLAVSGGALPYTYAWSNGTTAQNLSSLGQGSYSVIVTDANGCTATATVTIAEPTILLASITSSEDVSCNGANDGSIDLAVSGGTSPYTYVWSNGATAQNLSGLGQGSYSVTVTDANGCTATATVTIAEPTVLSASITSSEDVSCNGANDGSIDLTVSGGASPYTYAWSNGATAQNLSGLGQGSYTVTVTDANGCTATASVTIVEPTALSASITSSEDVSCNGANDGSIDLAVSGGVLPYTYAWSNGATAQNLSSLGQGSYTVTVSDANGCTATASVTIAEPTVLSASITSSEDVSCNGANDGSIDITVSGGALPYTYAWSNGSTAQNLSGLGQGNYTVTVTDANGCTATASLTIAEPTVLLASITSSEDVSCNGANDGSIDLTVSGGTSPYTYAWSNGATAQNLSGLGQGSYTVTVTDANGCTATATVTIAEPTVLSASITSSEDVSCNGANDGSIDLAVSGGALPYTYAWSNGSTAQNLSGLGQGSYTVTVTDANGCTATATVTIVEPTVLSASITSSEDVSCNGANDGSIDLAVSGGALPYTYAWSNGSTAQNLSGLGQGSYSVIVTDANGCTATASVTIAEPTVLLASITSSEDVSCNGANDGSIDLAVSGGTSPYTYAWSNGATAQNLSGLGQGSYSVTVTDANGCTATASVTIAEPEILTITSLTKTDALCYGANDGTANVVVNGGSGIYTYQWSPSGGTAATATGLAAGTYTILITDENGCEVSDSIIILSPSLLIVNGQPQNQIITVGSDTSFAVTADNVADYQWQMSTNGTTWSDVSNGGNSPVFSGATTNTLTLSNVPANYDGYLFRVLLSANSNCQTISESASLSIENVIEAVDDDFSANIITEGIGGIVGNVMDNDLFNNLAANSEVTTVSLVDAGGLAGITLASDGVLSLSGVALQGNYTITYSLCEVGNPSNCSTADAIVVVAPPLGRKDFEKFNISIYPNPSSSLVNVKVDNFAPDMNITVYDIRGRVIVEKKINGNLTPVDISSVEDGVYIFRITSGSDSFTKQIIKKH